MIKNGKILIYYNETMREIEVVLNFHRTKDGYSRAKTISPEGRDMLVDQNTISM